MKIIAKEPFIGKVIGFEITTVDKGKDKDGSIVYHDTMDVVTVNDRSFCVQDPCAIVERLLEDQTRFIRVAKGSSASVEVPVAEPASAE